MASFRAVVATCRTVVHVLRQSWQADWFNQQPEFEVYDADNFESHMTLGVSLFVFQVGIDHTHRVYPAQQRDKDPLKRPELPINVHFILTPWGKPDEALVLLGWMMRVIEDNAILPAGLLNAPIDGVFHEDEIVKITPGQLSSDHALRIFEQLPTHFKLSIPYVASVLRIESFRDAYIPRIVTEREYDYRRRDDHHGEV